MQLFCRSTFQPNLIHGRPSPKPTAPLTHNENMSLSLFSRTPALDGNDTEASRARILAHFHQTFDRYEQLFEVLACDEAYFKKPIALRHPLIFYFGHTATFFINKLLLVGLVTERINPRFESMFAIGVDEMSWDDLNDANYDWPRKVSDAW